MQREDKLLILNSLGLSLKKEEDSTFLLLEQSVRDKYHAMAEQLEQELAPQVFAPPSGPTLSSEGIP